MTSVTFRDIVMECDGIDCKKDTVWTTGVEDQNCGMEAHVSNGNEEISITWNTEAASKLDGLTRGELHELNFHGWAERLNIPHPDNENEV